MPKIPTVVKLIGVSALALYDTIGDITFLTSFPAAKLVGSAVYPIENSEATLSEQGAGGGSPYTYPTCTQTEAILENTKDDLAAIARCQAFAGSMKVTLGTSCSDTTSASRDVATISFIKGVVIRDGTYYPGVSNELPTQEDFTYCYSQMTTLLTAKYQADSSGATSSLSPGTAPSLFEQRSTFGAWLNIALDTSNTRIIFVDNLLIFAYLLLAVILIKEILKVAGVVSFFFHPYFHRPQNIAFILNSPLAFLALLFSPYFRKVAQEVTEQSRRGASPWPLFWDLLLEDLPQLFLPIFYTSIAPDRDPLVIFSLSGSVLMVIVAIARLMPSMYKEHVKAMSDMTDPPSAAPPTTQAALKIQPDISEALQAFSDKLLAMAGQLDGMGGRVRELEERVMCLEQRPLIQEQKDPDEDTPQVEHSDVAAVV